MSTSMQSYGIFSTHSQLLLNLGVRGDAFQSFNRYTNINLK